MAIQTVLLSQPFGNRSVVLCTLARQRAIKAVKRELQARGVRLSYIHIRDIRAFADAYFAAHRTEWIEQAKLAMPDAAPNTTTEHCFGGSPMLPIGHAARH